MHLRVARSCAHRYAPSKQRESRRANRDAYGAGDAARAITRAISCAFDSKQLPLANAFRATTS